MVLGSRVGYMQRQRVDQRLNGSVGSRSDVSCTVPTLYGLWRDELCMSSKLRVDRGNTTMGFGSIITVSCTGVMAAVQQGSEVQVTHDTTKEQKDSQWEEADLQSWWTSTYRNPESPKGPKRFKPTGVDRSI